MATMTSPLLNQQQVDDLIASIMERIAEQNRAHISSLQTAASSSPVAPASCDSAISSSPSTPPRRSSTRLQSRNTTTGNRMATTTSPFTQQLVDDLIARAKERMAEHIRTLQPAVSSSPVALPVRNLESCDSAISRCSSSSSHYKVDELDVDSNVAMKDATSEDEEEQSSVASDGIGVDDDANEDENNRKPAAKTTGKFSGIKLDIKCGLGHTEETIMLVEGSDTASIDIGNNPTATLVLAADGQDNIERSWEALHKSFPWACFLAKGGAKTVFKVYNVATEQEEAISVM
jgi:hypothetical protein